MLALRAQCIAHWVNKHGLPLAPLVLEYDLPCRPEHMNGESWWKQFSREPLPCRSRRLESDADHLDSFVAVAAASAASTEGSFEGGSPRFTAGEAGSIGSENSSDPSEAAEGADGTELQIQEAVLAAVDDPVAASSDGDCDEDDDEDIGDENDGGHNQFLASADRKNEVDDSVESRKAGKAQSEAAAATGTASAAASPASASLSSGGRTPDEHEEAGAIDQAAISPGSCIGDLLPASASSSRFLDTLDDSETEQFELTNMDSVPADNFLGPAVQEADRLFQPNSKELARDAEYFPEAEAEADAALSEPAEDEEVSAEAEVEAHEPLPPRPDIDEDPQPDSPQTQAGNVPEPTRGDQLEV